MTEQAQQTHPGIARFWPVVAALLLGLLHPLVAAAFAFLMAFARRYDRRVMVTLVVIGALWLVFMSLFMGWGGSGSGGGSTPIR